MRIDRIGTQSGSLFQIQPGHCRRQQRRADDVERPGRHGAKRQPGQFRPLGQQLQLDDAGRRHQRKQLYALSGTGDRCAGRFAARFHRRRRCHTFEHRPYGLRQPISLQRHGGENLHHSEYQRGGTDAQRYHAERYPCSRFHGWWYHPTGHGGRIGFDDLYGHLQSLGFGYPQCYGQHRQRRLRRSGLRLCHSGYGC